MANFGETLRRERELRDISLREIADATKINLRYLEALEQNRFDILPGGVFNKGFIRAYARFIGADGETFVDSYLQAMAAREAQVNGGGAAAPTAGMHRPSESPKRRAGSDPVAPNEGPQGHREPAAHITFAEGVAHPAATAPAPRPRVMEAEPSRAATKNGARTLVITTSLVAVAAITLLGLWLIRGLRPVVPARRPAPPPAAAMGGIPAAESTATTDPATAAPPATDDTLGPTAVTGSAAASAGAAGGPTVVPASAVPAPIATPGQAGPATAPPARQPEPARREDFINRSDDPGSASPRTTTPPRAQVASPVAPPLPGLAATAPRVETAAPGSMEFRIEAMAPVWVQIACDGDDRLNRALQPGEGVTLRCLSFVRLSVTDIGAVRLMVNGGRCAAPGERGSRIEGFVIRAEDAAVICPSQQGAAHGRN